MLIGPESFYIILILHTATTTTRNISKRYYTFNMYVPRNFQIAISSLKQASDGSLRSFSNIASFLHDRSLTCVTHTDTQTVAFR